MQDQLKQHEAPSIFDSGIGDWLLDLAFLALIALVLGNVLRWAYLALFHTWALLGSNEKDSRPKTAWVLSRSLKYRPRNYILET
jgi:hypothetical protein